MDFRSTGTSDSGATNQVRLLYRDWLEGWNEHNAVKMADLVAEDCNIVGFDGSQMNGRQEVETQLGKIFAHHQTAAYVEIVREVRLLSSDVAILRAVVGMVSPGQSDLNPAVNAIQSLVAVKQQGQWRIALFQNTPAAFHGRPELSEQLTAELRQALRGSS